MEEELIKRIKVFIDDFPWGENTETQRIASFAKEILTLIRKREKEWLDSISVERIKGLIEQHGMYLTPELDAFSMHKSSVGKLAEAISKLIRGE